MEAVGSNGGGDQNCRFTSQAVQGWLQCATHVCARSVLKKGANLRLKFSGPKFLGFPNIFRRFCRSRANVPAPVRDSGFMFIRSPSPSLTLQTSQIHTRSLRKLVLRDSSAVFHAGNAGSYKGVNWCSSVEIPDRHVERDILEVILCTCRRHL